MWGIWIMTAGILATILGSSVIVKLIECIFDRFGKQKKITQEIETLKEQQKSTDRKLALLASRSLILQLIRYFPQDTKAILAECDYYFYELHGDSWVINQVSEWGKKQGVNIDGYIKADRENSVEHN